MLNHDKLYFQDLKTQLILWAQNTTLLTNIKRKLIGSCSTSNKLGPYFNHVATFGSWSEIHTRTHIRTHILVHKQSFRERLDDGDFQYGLNVLLIISSSQVEKLDLLKPSIYLVAIVWILSMSSTVSSNIHIDLANLAVHIQ